MKSIAHFIIGKWWVCVLLSVAMSVAAVLGLFSHRGGGDMQEVKSAYQLKSELDGKFGSDGGDCLIVVDVVELGGDLFTLRRLDAVRELARRVESLAMVENVLSLEDVKTVNWMGLPTSLMPKAGAGAGSLEKAGARAVAHPLGRQILSADAQTLIMPVLFTSEAMKKPYLSKISAVRNALQGDAETAGQLRVRLTGLFALWEAERDAVNRDRTKFIIIGYLLTAALAIYLFRSLWVTAAIGLPAFVGVFWTVGILVFFEERPTPLTQVVMPMMLTMVGFTDAVHLMFHIRRARWGGESRVEAAISAVRELGMPCALTSLTTAVGFGSLMVAEAQVIRSFGMSCAIGVVLTFLAVVTLVPLLSLTRLGENVHLSHEHDFMEKHRPWAERVVGTLLGKARWVVVASALLLVVFALAASTLRPDNRFLSRLPDRSEAYQAMEHVDQHLGGTQVLRVSLEWEEGALDEPGLVAKLGEVDAILEAEKPLLGAPLSLRTILQALPGRGDDLAARIGILSMVPKQLAGGFYQPGPQAYDLRMISASATDELPSEGRSLVLVALAGGQLHVRIFDARGSRVIDKPEEELTSGAALTELKGLLDLGQSPDERGFSREEKRRIIAGAASVAGHTWSRRAVVAARVQDRGIAVYKPVFERVDAALEKLEVPGLQIEMTGDPIIWGRYLDRMVTDLLKSLALASAIILVVMGLVYRSVRIGLIAIVPNLFPVAATGAMLAIFRIPMVIETVCAFTICLGIAVDDTIHFLSRYRRELGRRGADEAIRESFIKVGSPLVVTTILMVTGFATVLWSELPGFRMFGAMACATLAAAFVADLVILPALLKVFGRRQL